MTKRSSKDHENASFVLFGDQLQPWHRRYQSEVLRRSTPRFRALVGRWRRLAEKKCGDHMQWDQQDEKEKSQVARRQRIGRRKNTKKKNKKKRPRNFARLV